MTGVVIAAFHPELDAADEGVVGSSGDAVVLTGVVVVGEVAVVDADGAPYSVLVFAGDFE